MSGLCTSCGTVLDDVITTGIHPGCVARLEAAIEAAERDLEAQVLRAGMELTPYAMRDQHGRYILLDGYTALANARAALQPECGHEAPSIVTAGGRALVCRRRRGHTPPHSVDPAASLGATTWTEATVAVR